MSFPVRDILPASYYHWLFSANETAGTVKVIKSQPGYLHGIVIGMVSTAGVLGLYDNASAATGTIIASLTISKIAAGANVPQFITFDAEFATGLTGSLTGYSDLMFSYV